MKLTPGIRIVEAGLSLRDWAHGIRQIPKAKLMAPPLDAKTRAVLLELGSWMSAKRPRCFRTMREIAKQTGLGESTVRHALMHARSLRWIVAERMPSNRGKEGETWYTYDAAIPIDAEYRPERTVPCNDHRPERTVPDSEYRPERARYRPERTGVPSGDDESTVRSGRQNSTNNNNGSNRKSLDPTPLVDKSTRSPSSTEAPTGEEPPLLLSPDYGARPKHLCSRCGKPGRYVVAGKKYCADCYRKITPDRAGVVVPP